MKTAAVLSVFGLALLAFDQKAPEADRKTLYLRADMPGVYLSYVRKGARPPGSQAEGNRGVWLSLHNNLKVSIQLFALADSDAVTPWRYVGERQVSFFKNGAKVRACYDVEGIPRTTSRVTGKAIEMGIPVRAPAPEPSPATSCLWFPDRGGLFSLAPGDSVVFSVPEEFVTADRRISTKYVHEWELDEFGYHLSTEPAHFVYFSLP